MSAFLCISLYIFKKIHVAKPLEKICLLISIAMRGHDRYNANR